MIRRPALALIAVAGALIGPMGAAQAAPAKAPTGAKAASGSDGDLQCMLVASMLSRQKEPQAQSLSQAMTLYYLGRVDARRPGLNLRQALQSEMQANAGTSAAPVAQRCAAAIQARVNVLNALGGPQGGPPPAAGGPAPPSPQ